MTQWSSWLSDLNKYAVKVEAIRRSVAVYACPAEKMNVSTRPDQAMDKKV